MNVSAAQTFLLPDASQAALRGKVFSPPAQTRPQVGLGIAPTTAAWAGVFGAAAVVVAANRRPAAHASKAAVTCRAFDPSAQVGATKPLGFFDPLGLTKNCTEEEFKNLRKSEIRHGRAAMMASLGLTVQSVYKLPGYENVPSGLAAQWTEPGSSTLLVTFFLIGCLEIGLGPWSENPDVPGDYGDPLNLGNNTVEMQNKELNNGRMAMFAVLGIVSAELYTSQTGLGQFATVVPRAATNGSSLCGTSLAAYVSTSTSYRAELSAMRSFDLKSQPGATAPLGAFDPLKLSSTQERFDKFRTSEVKHGRVAMMAALGAFFQHFVHGPGAEAVPNGIKAFSDPVGQKGVIALTLACGILELGPWADKFSKGPGDFGDPAGFGLDIGSYDKDMKSKELNNGRLAMMATMGLMAAEIVTGNPVSDLPTSLGL